MVSVTFTRIELAAVASAIEEIETMLDEGLQWEEDLAAVTYVRKVKAALRRAKKKLLAALSSQDNADGSG